MVGVSPNADQGGSSENKDKFINEKDEIASKLVLRQEYQVDKDCVQKGGNTVKRPLSKYDSEKINLLEIEERISKKMEGIEQMLKTTYELHGKMQENLKLWLKQRELDEQKKLSETKIPPHLRLRLAQKEVNENAKKRKIESEITIPQNNYTNKTAQIPLTKTMTVMNE